MRINQPTIGRGVQRINQASVQQQVPGKMDPALYDYSGSILITSGTGALTTVNTLFATYYQTLVNTVGINNSTQVVDVQIAFKIVTNGTGAGWLSVTLPFTSIQTTPFYGYYDNGVVLQTLTVANNTSNLLAISKYDGTYPGADGFFFYISGRYIGTN